MKRKAKTEKLTPDQIAVMNLVRDGFELNAEKSTQRVAKRLIDRGLLVRRGTKLKITQKGKKAHGPYAPRPRRTWLQKLLRIW